jgi:hypothetical protein
MGEFDLEEAYDATLRTVKRIQAADLRPAARSFLPSLVCR